MNTITSLTNNYIKSLYELSKNKTKKERREFLVDGLDFISMAYDNKCLKQILTLSYLEEYADIDQIIVTKQIIDKLSMNKSSSSAIGLCTYPQLSIDNAKKLVYLDGVQDPGNVGTIIRTALAFNYDGVILSSDSASLYNDKMISATKGAIFSLPIIDNISLADLKEKGYQIISTTLKEAVDYKNVSLSDKFVVVFGSEGQGIKQSTYDLSSLTVKIDMANIDSLNVGVAAGIILNEYRGK